MLLVLTLLASQAGAKGGAAQQGGEMPVYLPLVKRAACSPENMPRINAPGFSGGIPFEQTAIAWFGGVSPTQNYTDIRVGYNAQEIYVHLAITDRYLWFNEFPTTQTLTDWDAVSLYLDTSGGSSLSSSSWRIVAQLSRDPGVQYHAVYRGSPSGWQLSNVPITTMPGWRGNMLNDDATSDRGWVMGFAIPMSSLGLSTAPPQGTDWRIAVVVHDRDSADGLLSSDQSWPVSASPDNPACWSFLNFGLPTYTASAVPSGSVLIRRPTQYSPLVPDAAVGGTITNLCPGNDYHIWNEWGNLNYGSGPTINIQNQQDISDWPCFSKYYITFPLDGIPPGKSIVSAKLTVYQFGNSGAVGQAQNSWIQALVASADWTEGTITWNNAPLAFENITGVWVTPIVDFPGWPGVPYTWDVSYAVARAYARGEPLRLVLYESDAAYHSGKYFTTSDTEDWNTGGRPRLEVTWGER